MSTRLAAEIENLEDLDRLRTECQIWMKEGISALEMFLQRAPVKGSRHKTRRNVVRDGAADAEWDCLGIHEQAVVLKALCHPGVKPKLIEDLAAAISDRSAETILGFGGSSALFEPNSNSISFLEAARVLAAMASVPKTGFTAPTMFSYYTTVRELYYATDPEWSVGGARAGAGGAPSAHVTGLFVRAILSFARTLERTAAYTRTLAEIPPPPPTDLVPVAWLEVENARRHISLKTTLDLTSWNLAFAVEPIPKDFNTHDMKQFYERIPNDLVRWISGALKEFRTASKVVERFRKSEKAAARKSGTSPSRSHLIERSEAAHAVSFEALKDAAERAQETLSLFPKNRRGLTEVELHGILNKLTEAFNTAHRKTRRLIEPAIQYLDAALNRELAKAKGAGTTPGFEPAEMAAAAASFGSATGRWQDERILAAAQHLIAALTDDGFAVSQPYHVGEASFHLPEQSVILTSFAQILENVSDVELSASIVRRLVAYFRNTRVELKPGVSTWKWEKSRSSNLSAYHTAHAVIALDHIVRMLDTRINAEVLKYFEHRKPRAPKLPDLFYGDYGIAAEPTPGEGGSHRGSVAVYLERMRSHISGVALSDDFPDPLYSIVLHGPPGTGKTTLIEAIAASAEVEVVEVTPSDIVLRGTDAMEESARAVLHALSLLTKVVILFDEFDPVLRSRQKNDHATGSSIFTFLTAGMLPKLKRLHDAADKRRIAYALVTNYKNALDGAAIRGGRFDALVGIYPPDLLSRYSRLLLELKGYLGGRPITRKMEQRVHYVVLATARGPMHILGKPGWFTRPKGRPRTGTAFAYILDSDPRAEFVSPRPDPWDDAEGSEDEKLTGEERADFDLLSKWESPDSTGAPWLGQIWETVVRRERPVKKTS